MAPKIDVPSAVLVALGLAGCTHSQVCLSYAVCLDTDVQETGDTWGVCLSIAETAETGDTGDTGDTADTGPDTQEQRGRTGEGLGEHAETVERLADQLSDDVLSRLRQR